MPDIRDDHIRRIAINYHFRYKLPNYPKNDNRGRAIFIGTMGPVQLKIQAKIVSAPWPTAKEKSVSPMADDHKMYPPHGSEA